MAISSFHEVKLVTITFTNAIKVTFQYSLQTGVWSFLCFYYLWKKINLSTFTVFRVNMKLITSLIKIEKDDNDGYPNSLWLRNNFTMAMEHK